jgi:hypothetical protein
MTKPAAEPLRLFLRGFLRDHLGYSTIVADSMSVIFIKRWLARDQTTVDRYNREDVHTLEAAFDRRAMAEADRMSGLDTPMTPKMKAHVEKVLRSQDDKFDSAPRNFGLRQRPPTTNEDLVDLGTGKVADRQTFTVPDGYEAVRDHEGRATGEIKPSTTPKHPKHRYA